jgi:predicted RNase H-like HicB family nuclease
MHDVLMKMVRYAYWQDSEMWLGYIEEFPDYMTQGETLDELRENLKDIYREIKEHLARHILKKMDA